MVSLTLQNELIAGFSAGVVGTVLGYPLDAIKTRMQTTASETRKGFFGTLRHALKTEGPLALYRGIAAPLLSLTILNTLNFSIYSLFKRALSVPKALDLGTFDVRVAIAGAAVGPLSACISTPFELLKTRMQVQKSLPPHMQYRNTIHAAYRIVRTDGFRGLYLGHGVNVSREIVFLATYFSIYEHGKSLISSLLPSSLAVPLAGGISGGIGWFVSFPLDCVKSHIQSNLSGGTAAPLRFFPVFVQIIRSKGIFGLFSGVVPSVLRAFIVSSSRFSAYEGTLWILRAD